MKQKITSMVLVLVFMLSMCIPAYAASTSEEEIQPQPRTTLNITCSLSMYSGTQIKSTVTAISSKNENITIVMNLQRKEGSTWRTYRVYTKTGTGQYLILSKILEAPLGYDYRIKADVITSSISGTGYSKILYWY